ncbi:MAG: leucine-rich repeat protein, partial [Eubacteriaceae bacterium]|nr:leucine-rich repeat protein [Eubacteriaceae bacterium]
MKSMKAKEKRKMKAKKYSVFLVVFLMVLLCASPIVFGQETEQSDGAIVVTGENESEVVVPNTAPNEESENLDDVDLKTQSVEGDWTYFVKEDGSIKLYEYNGKPTNFVIPSQLAGRKVSIVGGVLSKENSINLKSVIIPEGVTKLDSCAFDDAPYLETVQLPSTLKVIRNGCFARCPNLKYVDIPYNVEIIAPSAFQDSPVNFHYNREMIKLGDGKNGLRIVDHHVNVKAIMDYDKAKQMMELTNEERAKKGRARVCYNKKLTEFGMLRAVECMLFFDHSSPSSPYECLDDSYDPDWSGENICGSSGLLTVDGAHSGFVNSKGHWNQMVDPNNAKMGAGFAYSTDASTMGSACTENFSVAWGLNLDQDGNGNYIDRNADEEIPTGRVIKSVPVYYLPSYVNIETEFGTNTGERKYGQNDRKAKHRDTKDKYNDALTELSLEQGSSQKVRLYAYTSAYSDDGTGLSRNHCLETEASWVSSNPSVAKVDQDGNVTAVGAGTATITATTGTESNSFPVTVTAKQVEPTPTPSTTPTPTVSPQPTTTPTPTTTPEITGQQVVYRTHVESVGWQPYVTNATMSGTSGRSLRLEGMNIKLVNKRFDGNIEYRTHIQNVGWETSWKKNDAFSGTNGQGLRLEAMQVRLTGEMAKHYDICYRVHAEGFGWLNWAKNGQPAGTEGYGYRLEGMQLMLVEKDQNVPSVAPLSVQTDCYKKNNDPGFYIPNSAFDQVVEYTTHVQNVGWQPYMTNGMMAGTSGQSLRLEGLRIKLNNQKYNGTVLYRTHIQNIGWESTYRSGGSMSGTSGRSLRLEAMQISLSGEMAEHYDIYYRVHAQNIGWLGWAKNGESAGTAGYGYR